MIDRFRRSNCARSLGHRGAAAKEPLGSHSGVTSSTVILLVRKLKRDPSTGPVTLNRFKFGRVRKGGPLLVSKNGDTHHAAAHTLRTRG